MRNKALNHPISSHQDTQNSIVFDKRSINLLTKEINVFSYKLKNYCSRD